MESEASFRNMSSYAPVMIWFTGASGDAEYINKRWFEFTRQTVEQTMGRGWLGVCHPEDKPGVEDTLASEKDVLEMVPTGTPLPAVLDGIVRTVERQSPDGMLRSVMLEEEGGDRLIIGP